MRPVWLLPALVFVAALGATIAQADVENNLVFRRQNGETIQFATTARAFAWCGPYEVGNAPTPTYHVIFYDTTLVDHRYWRLWAIPRDIVLGEPQLFPNYWMWPNPDSVDIFVGDPPNEATTDVEEAGGWIVFDKLDCAAGGEVAFTIGARIGSEFGGGPFITVTGTFRATVTGSPFPPGLSASWGAIKATYR